MVDRSTTTAAEPRGLCTTRQSTPESIAWFDRAIRITRRCSPRRPRRLNLSWRGENGESAKPRDVRLSPSKHDPQQCDLFPERGTQRFCRVLLVRLWLESCTSASSSFHITDCVAVVSHRLCGIGARRSTPCSQATAGGYWPPVRFDCVPSFPMPRIGTAPSTDKRSVSR